MFCFKTYSLLHIIVYEFILLIRSMYQKHLMCFLRFEDSCTIFVGRRRICFELLPPVRPEMIAVRRLAGGDEA